ncbi:hypothetical protein [Streptomyces meridianus]|uniref:Uncharacterized protein n=1 Tax=Streptomyces meridianus TaxID=2938945 RepID=A0ABT0X0F2_9ACTN|nr:hypothetical protein [Streptomyces meridianus]MCM2576036.1 hypothetical protein [Streptomyces meridianus]
MPEFTAPLVAAAAPEGPGLTLRILVVASVVGVALLAWFLLRGYGGHDR